MSREFGEYHAPGYFHTKLENAADDAAEGRWEPTKLMEPALRALHEAARVCSAVEACDSSAGADRQAAWIASMHRAKQEIAEAICMAEAREFE
jgi:hypothetical protein